MITLTATTCFLIAVTFLALALILLDQVRSKRTLRKNNLENGVQPLPEPPGPKPWPILGSLHILGRYDVPYKAFADLVRDYGCQVIKLRMGSVPCAVVNGLDNIREVLTIKGHHFDSRPNFARYHLLFGGNKENCKKISITSVVRVFKKKLFLRADISNYPYDAYRTYSSLRMIIEES